MLLCLLLLACARDDDHDGVTAPADCDDADATVFPGARERCNGVDDDCSGAIDEAGAAGATAWYVDADGDGHAAADAPETQACTAPPKHAALRDDCDDADATRYTGAPEEKDGADDDCDGRVDETPVDEGLVYISEIARQPRFGRASVAVEGQWFEVHNAGTAPVDLAGIYVTREDPTVGRDGFYVPPTRDLVVPPGGHVVFCKSTEYAAPGDPKSALRCDYVWGDLTMPPTWSSASRDNTFNLQRDSDSLALYLRGDHETGRLVDSVAWSWGEAKWPRDATRAIALDPSAVGADANDRVDAWCSAPLEGARWWDQPASDGGQAIQEFGTPGAPNPACKGRVAAAP